MESGQRWKEEGGKWWMATLYSELGWMEAENPTTHAAIIELTFHSMAEATALNCRWTASHNTWPTSSKERSRCRRAMASIGRASLVQLLGRGDEKESEMGFEIPSGTSRRSTGRNGSCTILQIMSCYCNWYLAT